MQVVKQVSVTQVVAMQAVVTQALVKEAVAAGMVVEDNQQVLAGADARTTQK